MRDIDRQAIALMMAPRYTTATVSGTEQISLPNAKANSLTSLKLFGKCEQDGTPTPDAPIPILCNNGELKVRRPSGLPLEYQKVEWLQSDGACYVDTGRVPNNNDIIEQKFKKNGTSTETCAWYGSMPSTSTTTPRIGFGSYSQGMFCGVNTTTTLQASINTNVHVAKFQATASNRMLVTYDGETKEVTASGSGSGTLYSPAVALTSYLFARHGTSGVQTYDNEGTRIYYHKEYLNNGTIQLDLVPVRRISDGVFGMYDLVADIFHPKRGSGSFTAGPDAEDLEVYADGTVEQIQVTPSDDTATCENLLSVGTYEDVQSIIDGSVTRNVGIKVLNGSEDWSTATLTNCYTLNNQPLGRGLMSNRRVVCTHFSSSDTLPDANARQGLALIGNTGGASPTYTVGFGATTQFPTISDWNAFLATQYANGTPVIIVYPLAEPTTEEVTPQSLTLRKGNNVATIVQASLEGLELEATYKARKT